MTFGIYLVIFFLAADICHNEGKTSVRQFSVNNVRRVNIPHRSRTNTCDLNFAKDKCSVDEHGLFKMSMSNNVNASLPGTHSSLETHRLK